MKYRLNVDGCDLTLSEDGVFASGEALIWTRGGTDPREIHVSRTLPPTEAVVKAGGVFVDHWFGKDHRIVVDGCDVTEAVVNELSRPRANGSPLWMLARDDRLGMHPDDEISHVVVSGGKVTLAARRLDRTRFFAKVYGNGSLVLTTPATGREAVVFGTLDVFARGEASFHGVVDAAQVVLRSCDAARIFGPRASEALKVYATGKSSVTASHSPEASVDRTADRGATARLIKEKRAPTEAETPKRASPPMRSPTVPAKRPAETTVGTAPEAKRPRETPERDRAVVVESGVALQQGASVRNVWGSGGFVSTAFDAGGAEVSTVAFDARGVRKKTSSLENQTIHVRENSTGCVVEKDTRLELRGRIRFTCGSFGVGIDLRPGGELHFHDGAMVEVAGTTECFNFVGLQQHEGSSITGLPVISTEGSGVVGMQCV